MSLANIRAGLDQAAPFGPLARRARLALGVLALLLVAAPGRLPGETQTSKPTVIPATPPTEQPPSDRSVPLLQRPLHLYDFVDMAPRADLLGQLTEISGFIQNTPSDGEPATQQTSVWMGYTKSALYVVFICHDDQPNLIRSHLARRENILNDDTVSVLLDTFEDHRKGILFSQNPAGVQADAAWTEGAGPDYSYDQVWDSEARITPTGWMALFAIPFRSLRFRPREQGWGVVFMRSLPRNSEVDDWPRITTNIAGTLPQEGTLRGIHGVTGSHNIQFSPYTLGQNEHTLLNQDPLNPYFSSRAIEGTAGGEAKAILKDSIIFDATINPDFSDIESDQPQFTVDQRYPVYFPELRPFFLENANYFATPIDLVYTRNIVHPEYGGRVTGKLHNTNFGAFASDDREPGQTVAPGQMGYGDRALFAVGRVSQDLGKGSSIGAIYTDEEFAGSWNRIGGVDFTARFNDNWTAQGQAVESSSKLFGGGYAAGPASYLEFTRSGHSFGFDNTYKDYSTGFQSQTGFIQTTDFHNNNTTAVYDFYPKKSVVQAYVLQVTNNIAFDHQGNRLYHYTQLTTAVTLPRNTVIGPIFGDNSDTVGPQDGYALAANHNFTENYIGVTLKSAPVPQFNFNIVALRGGNVNYYPANGIPFLLNQDYLQALVTFQPVRSLTVDNTYLLDRDHAAHGGQFVYESQTLRTKIDYQFTRAFSARVITEYDSVLANPLEASLERTKQVSTEALFTWLPHPGTAIYLGYNNDIQNLDRTLCNRTIFGSCNPNNPVAPRSTQYLNDGRQIFLKVSYLIRF